MIYTPNTPTVNIATGNLVVASNESISQVDENIEIEISEDATNEDSIITIEDEDGNLEGVYFDGSDITSSSDIEKIANIFAEDKLKQILAERESCAQIAELWASNNGEFIAQKIREQ